MAVCVAMMGPMLSPPMMTLSRKAEALQHPGAATESSLSNTTTTAEFGPMVTVTAPLLNTSGTGVTSDAATNTLSCAADGPFGRPIACHAASGFACASSILYSVARLGGVAPLTATVTVRLSRYDGGPPFSQNERNTDGCCCTPEAS